MEVLFALLIMSFGLVAFLSLFSEMTRSTIDDEFTMTGSHLATQKLEEVLANKAAFGYANLPIGIAEEKIHYGNHEFTRNTSIQWVETSDLKTVSGVDTGFKRVDVGVSWNEGTLQQVQLMSLVSNY